MKDLTLVFHSRPHFDEMLAATIIVVYGRKEYGDRVDRLRFIEYTGGENSILCSDRDHLLIGVGESMFNEHATPSQPATATSAALLVARHLRCDQSPELNLILDYAGRVDTQGEPEIFSLARMLELYARTVSINDALCFAIRLIRSYIQEERKRLRYLRTPLEYIFREKIILNGEPVTIGIVEGDWEGPGKGLLRNKLLIVLRPPAAKMGHIQIFTKRSGGLVPDLSPFVRALRVAEFIKKVGSPIASHELMENGGSEGTINSVPEWHYYKATGMISNGSPTHPYISKSKLSVEEIWEIIKLQFHSVDWDCKIGEPTPATDPACV